MDNNGREIVRTYNLGQTKKVSIRYDGKCYYTVNDVVQPHLPPRLAVYNKKLYCKKNNDAWQECTAESYPSTMLFHGKLINFDNYNEHLWPSMGNELAQIYRTWRSYPAKIPDKAKNQFKKAFILIGKYKINLNKYLDPNSCQPFSIFFDFAKTILYNTNSVNDCNNLNTIFQFCCLPHEKAQLDKIYNQRIQQLKGNNQGFYQKNHNNFNNQFNQNNNQLNHFNNNQNYNNQVVYITTITHQFFGELKIFWRHDGTGKALITGLTINGTKSDANLGTLNQGQSSIWLPTIDNQYIDIQFQNNILRICDIRNHNQPLTTINLLTQKINQNQNFNANHNVNKRNTVQEVFIQNNANQQNFQQQFAPDENNVLDSIQQFYTSDNFKNKYWNIRNYYYNIGNKPKYDEISNIKLNANNANVLNDYFNKEYAKIWINKFTAQVLKQLVLKCNYNDKRTANFRSFLEDAGCRELAAFLEKPFITLNSQQKLNIIQATFNQNNLLPSPQYKKYFGDIRFRNFLAWYAQQQNLPDKPNSDYLAKLFGGCKTNNWAFEQNRYNAILQWQISVNNNGQLLYIPAGSDKIIAYYIGYILFSNDTNTQAFGRLFAIQTIFPWAKKYSYNYFGNIDWFPEAKPPLIGGVEICQPKPMDENVKKCLKKLSQSGIDNLGSEYQVSTNNGKTTIKKGGKLIFHGKLSADKKGFADGMLVIKYDNQDQPDEYYKGQFKDTKMEGKGTYVFAKRFPDKEKHEAYEGQFKDGQMHGSGTYYTADGFSAEITYKNGIAMNVKKAKDRSDTDVIVFDFFGFSSEAFEDEKHGGRYNSSFFITDDGSYQYKREKIFGLKDGEGLQKISDYYPSAGQQKAMDFIKTHMLINKDNNYEAYSGLLDENKLRNIEGFDLDKTIKEFGIIGGLNQLDNADKKEKWLCFVIDKIGPDAFNKLYLKDNIDYHFGEIKKNKNKKLKIVLNIHGTPQLGMSFGPKDQRYKEKFELINNVFQKAASLGRDMYVSNNSCYGSQFLDDKQDIFKQIGLDIFANEADFKQIITHTEIDKSINYIKAKYKSTNNFLNICKLKAEADSWRLTKNYSMIKRSKDLLKYKFSSLKDFFVNIFYNVYNYYNNIGPSLRLLANNKIFLKQQSFTTPEVLVIGKNNVLGSEETIEFLKAIEKIHLSDRLKQPFEEHIRDFFDFVKKKLFEGDSLDQLTKEGKKIDDAIEARNKIVRDLVEEEEIDDDNMSTAGLENPGYKLIPYSELESLTKKNHKVKKEVIKYGKEEVLKKIDQACEALKKTKKDEQQIESIKQEISEEFEKNGVLEPYELIDMLSKVDLFYPDAGSLFKKFEDEFVKEKMEKRLKDNKMTLEQLDEFGTNDVNKMLGHLSTSIWLTRSFLLGGVLSKKMGVDKILEGFREKCYQLLYKFGDQEINYTAIQKLQTELRQEIGKIKKEITTKIEEYVAHIKMDNWNSVNGELQELKNEILTTDNYYTQQLSPEQIEALKQQKFTFDKENFVNFLQLLPGKIEASINKAKENIVNYCKDIKNNNKQSIKDLLKQLKNGPMQNKHIIYSANMTGMTPSYMIELIDEQQKTKSNRNLGKMYYEVKNGQIVPLVKDKQEYEKALRKFENKLANIEKRGSANDTPGLQGIKFHAIDDIERIQSEELMKFVKEGKRKKNEIMGWIGKEEGIVEEKSPEDAKGKKPRDNYARQFNIISNDTHSYNKNHQNNIIKNEKQNNNNFKAETNERHPLDNKQQRNANNGKSTYGNYNNYNVTTGVK